MYKEKKGVIFSLLQDGKSLIIYNFYEACKIGENYYYSSKSLFLKIHNFMSQTDQR